MALRFFHQGLNGVHEAVSVVGFLVGTYRGLRCSTTLVTEDDDQRSLEVFNSVLDATDDRVVGHIARHTNHKQIAEPLVENYLGADSRIGATENYCEQVRAGSISRRRARL